MVNYLLTPLHRHYDYGFGATGEAFKSAADRLLKPVNEEKLLNGHLPINFLLRHAIELFLKSLIIIIHKRLKLPFGNEAFDGIPKILQDTSWKPIHKVHSIALLYQYFKSLLVEHKLALHSVACTDWSDIPPGLNEWILAIEDADSMGTFFRYPDTRDHGDNKDKSAFKERQVQDTLSKMTDGGKYVKAFVVLDDNDNIIDSFEYDDAPLENLQLALKQAAETLSVFHFGMRCELTGGW
jgi:hypothetical protein